MLLLSDGLMSYCTAGTYRCLDWRRRAFAQDGRVSVEWSRCLGSMPRRARKSLAPLRRSSAGWVPERIERLSAGVGAQASSHNSQGVVDGGVNKADMSTAAQDKRSTLRLNGPWLVWLFTELLLQHLNRSQLAVSEARRVMSASCEVTEGVGDK